MEKTDGGDYVRVGVEDKNVSMGLETDMGVEWCSKMLAVLSHSGAATPRDSPGARVTLVTTLNTLLPLPQFTAQHTALQHLLCQEITLLFCATTTQTVSAEDRQTDRGVQTVGEVSRVSWP